MQKYFDTLREVFTYYLGIILLCALVFSFSEGKTIIDSIWWAIVTASTTGYGDMYPVTLGGRIAGIVIMHIVPFVIIPIITAHISARFIVDSDAFTHQEQVQIIQSLEEIKEKLNEHSIVLRSKDD